MTEAEGASGEGEWRGWPTLPNAQSNKFGHISFINGNIIIIDTLEERLERSQHLSGWPRRRTGGRGMSPRTANEWISYQHWLIQSMQVNHWFDSRSIVILSIDTAANRMASPTGNNNFARTVDREANTIRWARNRRPPTWMATSLRASRTGGRGRPHERDQRFSASGRSWSVCSGYQFCFVSIRFEVCSRRWNASIE